MKWLNLNAICIYNTSQNVPIFNKTYFTPDTENSIYKCGLRINEWIGDRFSLFKQTREGREA